MTRKPTTPGEILDEEFLKPLGMTQKGSLIIWVAT
jgi:plasmid maintenance system antidote protein VapI